MNTLQLSAEFYFGGGEPPRPSLTIAAPLPSDWCFDCMQIMRKAGAVYVCKRCGMCQFKPVKADHDD